MRERAKCSRWQYILMAREPACLAVGRERPGEATTALTISLTLIGARRCADKKRRPERTPAATAAPP
eukprot:3122780-Pleurochrysis_carterae.AAC.2